MAESSLWNYMKIIPKKSLAQTGEKTPGEGGGREMRCPSPEYWIWWSFQWRGDRQGPTHQSGYSNILCTGPGIPK